MTEPEDETRRLQTDPAPPFEDEETTGPNHAVPTFAGDSPPAIPPGVDPHDWREALLRKVVRFGQGLKELEGKVKDMRTLYDELTAEFDAEPSPNAGE